MRCRTTWPIAADPDSSETFSGLVDNCIPCTQHWQRAIVLKQNGSSFETPPHYPSYNHPISLHKNKYMAEAPEPSTATSVPSEPQARHVIYCGGTFVSPLNIQSDYCKHKLIYLFLQSAHFLLRYARSHSLCSIYHAS